MVFRSKSHHRLEWVEFQLNAETEEDRHQADNSLCTSEGVNHAEVEYGHDNVATQNINQQSALADDSRK